MHPQSTDRTELGQTISFPHLMAASTRMKTPRMNVASGLTELPFAINRMTVGWDREAAQFPHGRLLLILERPVFHQPHNRMTQRCLPSHNV